MEEREEEEGGGNEEPSASAKNVLQWFIKISKKGAQQAR